MLPLYALYHQRIGAAWASAALKAVLEMAVAMARYTEGGKYHAETGSPLEPRSIPRDANRQTIVIVSAARPMNGRIRKRDGFHRLDWRLGFDISSFDDSGEDLIVATACFSEISSA